MCPDEGIEPITLAYQDDNLANWATWPELLMIFDAVSSSSKIFVSAIKMFINIPIMKFRGREK